MSTTQDWEIVIGLQVHAQLATQTKIFSRESAAYGAEPNSHVNEVCAGLPGVLPVLNRDAVELAMKAGYALGCDVHRWSQFDRKNYFYPDLPKGYQISQFTHPICTGGHVDYLLDGQVKRCNLTRIHMEEDAGKSTHVDAVSLVDLNRAGTPLIEIVSEPELRSAEEAAAYLRELRLILRTLEVCDGNMDEGSFRCDANVSVRRPGAPLGTRAEIKNINSFRFVLRAIDYEVARQIDVIESGGAVVQETRLFNSNTGRTSSMRGKEEAHDYRYFPDPDLPPLVIDEAWADRVAGSLPELPMARRLRYQETLGLSAYDADNLTAAAPVARFFEAALAAHPGNPKGVANWVLNDLMANVANPEEDLDALPITPDHLAQLVRLIDDQEINGKIAKTVFTRMLATGRPPAEICDEEGLRPISDPARIRPMLEQLLADNPSQVAGYRAGKLKLLGFFIGQAMQLTKGKADPNVTKDLLVAMLEGGEG